MSDDLHIDPPWPDADAQQHEWDVICAACPWLAGYLDRSGHARQPSRDDLRAAILWLACDASWRDALKVALCGELRDSVQEGRS